MLKPIEINTDRLLLRQWRDSDREPFARLNADSKVMEFFFGTLDRSASNALLDRIRSLIAERGWGLWAVEVSASAEFIGFVGLHIPAAALPFSPCVEVGWRLAHRHWGKGYAVEAARAALRTGFEVVGLDEIVSFTTVKNLRSRAVMEKLGMQQDADTFEHPDLLIHSPLRRHCLYRLSRRRWESHGNGSDTV